MHSESKRHFPDSKHGVYSKEKGVIYMALEDDYIEKPKKERPEHYYGDTVRKLFLTSGVIMLLFNAFFFDLISTPTVLTVLGAIIIVILAGLQNPRHLWLNILNTCVSAIACFVFTYTGIQHYMHADVFNVAFFWSNQLLGLLFLFATYYSSKTIRAKIVSFTTF